MLEVGNGPGYSILACLYNTNQVVAVPPIIKYLCRQEKSLLCPMAGELSAAVAGPRRYAREWLMPCLMTNVASIK